MVKNVKGGSGHKSQARKFAGTTPKQSNKLRVIEEEGEIYGKIVKMYGNGMCDALCIDNIVRLCIIRGKFRGRGKRDNTIALNSWILAGKRDWESVKEDEKQKCDLLEVYNDFDIERLKKNVHEDWKLFANSDFNHGPGGGEANPQDAFEFTNANNEEHDELMKSLKQEQAVSISLANDGDDEDVCVDDI
jgi:initiation factor 1A